MKAAEEFRIKHKPDVILVGDMELSFAPLDGDLDPEVKLLQLD